MILCLVVYLAWFLTGKPNITVDYVAELNKIVRPVADDSLNAAPLYEKAVELYGKPPKNVIELLRKEYHDTNDTEKQFMQKWLTENEEVFELLIASTQKPYYWSYASPCRVSQIGLRFALAGAASSRTRAIRGRLQRYEGVLPSWSTSKRGQIFN